MKNRETTYYSLTNSEHLAHIEQTADTLNPEAFITLGFDKKWYGHLWIPENNECFLDRISHFEDLNKLDAFLGEQLKLYARKNERDNDEGYLNTIYEARKDWLKHTIFICKNEYRKTKNEVYKEVIKWCKDWQKDWLDTFNPDKDIDKVKDASSIITTLETSTKSKTPLMQIALLYIYENRRITNNNKNDIAHHFGHKSGHKLIQFYNKLIKSTDRTGDPGSNRMMKHKIRMFESVVSMLSDDDKKHAEKDLQHLKKLYNEHYQ